MKHILVIVDYYLPHQGGIENVFENYLKRMTAKGYKISLLTSRFSDDLAVQETIDDITIYRTGSSRASFARKSLFLGYKICKKNTIDLIHTSTYSALFPASMLGLLCKKKVLATVHEVFGSLRNVYKGARKGRWYQCIEKVLLSLPITHYQCVSHYTMNSLRLLYGISDKKLSVIHNGVDINFWNPNIVTEQEKDKLKEQNHRKEKNLILYYGHAGKSKGVDTLIEAIPELLKQKNTHLICNIIPSKRSEEILKKLHEYKQKNPEKITIFQGLSKQDLRILVASVDMVVAPSWSEGFGSVHTEVCAMQKPLITTNVASIPEVVRGQVSFIRPQSVSELLAAVKNNNKEYISSNNKKTIPTKVFDRDSSADMLDLLYKSL